MGKTGGTTGTNQYQVRGRAKVGTPPPPAFDTPLDDLDSRMRRQKTEIEFARRSAADPDTAPEVLARLVTHGDSQTRRGALRNPSTPARTLIDNYAEMGGVAEVTRPDSEDMVAVLKNPACPAAILRHALQVGMTERTVPGRAYEQLSSLRAAASHPNADTAAVTELVQQGRLVYTSDLHMSPDWLRARAASPNYEHRADTAANRYTPPDVLAQLATDKTKTVLVAVAGNPACPPAVLSKFLRHRDKDIKTAVLNNPGLPDHLRAIYNLTNQ